MARSSSYKEWYSIAKSLDDSQNRSQWTHIINDDTAYRYSWPFILELLQDLKMSREKGDVIMAMAVLQQCTRKNVGGIMSEDMFSYTNAGEPKAVVEEFVHEVANTLKWVTEVVTRMSVRQKVEAINRVTEKETAETVERELKVKREKEENKLYASIMDWATLNILNPQKENGGDKKAESTAKGPSSSVPSTPKQSQSQFAMSSIDEDHKNLILRTKIKTFLKRARAAYGRTALCLSGGALLHLFLIVLYVS